MDSRGDFFFVSHACSYRRTLSTIYEGKFSNGSVTGVALVPGISKSAPGWVNFDADISTNGSQLYFDDGDYGRSGHLLSAKLTIAAETRTGFVRLPTADKILGSVNDAGALIYAPDISRDGLRLYYTRAPLPFGSGPPSIFVATRSTVSRAFGRPSRLARLHGFVEAPALAPDGRGLYFHQLVGSRLRDRVRLRDVTLPPADAHPALTHQSSVTSESTVNPAVATLQPRPPHRTEQPPQTQVAACVTRASIPGCPAPTTHFGPSARRVEASGSPVSRSDFRLERNMGQPLLTMVAAVLPGSKSSWTTVSLTMSRPARCRTRPAIAARRTSLANTSSSN